MEKKLYFMPPEYVINLWLLSQELNLNILRDVSLAFCLDRFEDLPLNSIYELSKENFLKLIENINITSTKAYLLKVSNKWMDYHNVSTSILFTKVKLYKLKWCYLLNKRFMPLKFLLEQQIG